MQMRCRDRELQVLLPKKFRLDHTDFESGLIEEKWITVWSARWMQFPTTDWEQMQDGIMQKIQAAIGDTQEDTNEKMDTLYDAAIEAVEHMAQANWGEREQAAKRYLAGVFNAEDDISLDEIQREINDE